MNKYSRDRAYAALEGLMRWLGFDDFDDYVKTLERERERIFDRATY